MELLYLEEEVKKIKKKHFKSIIIQIVEQEVGSLFLRLVLECIFQWKKFKSQDKNATTTFTEVYDDLLKHKVTFPKPEEMIFYIQKPKKKPEGSAQLGSSGLNNNNNPPKNATPSGFSSQLGGDKTKWIKKKKGTSFFNAFF